MSNESERGETTQHDETLMSIPDTSPLLVPLPNEITMYIISYLDANDLTSGLSSASRLHRSYITKNHKIWQPRCDNLWSDKIYVHPRYRNNNTATTNDDNIKTYKTYFGSIIDSKRCIFEDEDELCSLHFHFRFRPAAGEFWMAQDSSYNGNVPIYRRYRPDGSLSIHPDHSIPSDIGMPLTKYCVAPSPDPLSTDLLIRLVPRVSWRFTKSRRGVKGQYVKLNDWPALHIGRTDDWGWTLTSPWTYYRTCCKASSTLSKEWMNDVDDYKIY